MNQCRKDLVAPFAKRILISVLIFLSLFILSSCGFKASSKGSNLLVSSSYAALCNTPVYAHLYKLKNDGTIDDAQILLSELVGSDAKYSFDLTAANLAPFTLGTGSIYNFTFNTDASQLWYFKSTGGLYCYDISSGKSWCDNSTDHFSIRTAAGLVVANGADQMTFKNNQTLFVSTHQGEILQFNLPTTP